MCPSGGGLGKAVGEGCEDPPDATPGFVEVGCCEAVASEKVEEVGVDVGADGIQRQVRDALYAQYRVLSQLAHTNVLGMIATVQPGSDSDVSIGQRLSDPVAALVIHSAAASVFVVACHTVHTFIDGGFEADQATDLSIRAMSIVGQIAFLLSPIHQLTP